MLIVPKADALTEPYWQGVKDGKLLLQNCRSCGLAWHPPTPICPACQAKNYEWRPASGRGTVYSFTVVHHAAHVAVARKVPYLVALVTLEEGPRVVSNILSCPAERVQVGMPVTLTFQEISPGVVLPQFEAAQNLRT
ncbi:Zn-ribbon domain-containing OB-fold protein [Vineibacter terrae]|uniref:Zn-ribbon domain-containing OB-fold protein n=1 Tax=Vineibacter terrae TaxID=2586908 RepID=A0A5C8PCT4_9HYPH|nr:Zn-ribbon domain-containing OB-fold protein [Vineibacter terrae]TXL71361.1 Zn-ribbon domain-containing OB-fold protein [Vineibacter terrae]